MIEITKITCVMKFFLFLILINVFSTFTLAYYNSDLSRQQSYNHNHYHSLRCSSTIIRSMKDESLTSDEPKKKKKKSKTYKDMILYNEMNIKPFSLVDTYNSTTLKLLVNIKDDLSDNWAKVERIFASWVVVVKSKVERDIKTTFKTSEFVTRKVTTESNKLWSDLTEKSKPLLSLPATIQKLSTKEDTWGLIRAGVNPLKDNRLLGNFGAVSTKQRAKLSKKKAPKILAVDSVYRSIRLLPKKLQYDFNRRQIAESQSSLSYFKQLSDGSGRGDENYITEEVFTTPVLSTSVEYEYYSTEQEREEVNVAQKKSAKKDRRSVTSTKGGTSSIKANDVLIKSPVDIADTSDTLQSDLQWLLEIAKESLDLLVLEWMDANEMSLPIDQLIQELEECNRLDNCLSHLDTVERKRDARYEEEVSFEEVEKDMVNLRISNMDDVRKRVGELINKLTMIVNIDDNRSNDYITSSSNNSTVIGWIRGQDWVKERIKRNSIYLQDVYSHIQGLEVVFGFERKGRIEKQIAWQKGNDMITKIIKMEVVEKTLDFSAFEIKEYKNKGSTEVDDREILDFDNIYSQEQWENNQRRKKKNDYMYSTEKFNYSNTEMNDGDEYKNVYSNSVFNEYDEEGGVREVEIDDKMISQEDILDITAETSATDSDKLILRLGFGIDVLFFLAETIIKTVGTILRDGGLMARDRAVEALFGNNISVKYLKRTTVIRNKSDNIDGQDIANSSFYTPSWILLSDFKKQTV